MSATVLPVPGASPYDVVVGADLVDRLPGMLGDGVQRVALIHSERLGALATPVRDVLAEHYQLTLLPIPDGEAAKDVATAAACWQALGEAGFTRSDAVVTLGGGATTDLGGFVAATWLRGVRVVHLPTTLLAMVDAAVGGKTGLNTGSGKNLVGAFHEPAGVLCDLASLASLPREDFVSGLGEVVKCGFIADPEILALVEAGEPGSLTPDSAVLQELVERALKVKITIVVQDFKETLGSAGHPGREVLNYGHTMGHAIEKVEHYRIRHGEAVALGCVYVAELAGQAGLAGPDLVARHRSAFARVGLPTTYDGASFADLHAAMQVDKKTRGSQLRFIVLPELARPEVLTAPAEADLRAAYDALAGAAR